MQEYRDTGIYRDTEMYRDTDTSRGTEIYRDTGIQGYRYIQAYRDIIQEYRDTGKDLLPKKKTRKLYEIAYIV